MIFDEKNVLVDVDGLPLYQRLRIKRVLDGFTQPQLCELLGLPNAPYLSRMERGERPIPKRCMERIEQYLYKEVYKDGQLQKNVD